MKELYSFKWHFTTPFSELKCFTIKGRRKKTNSNKINKKKTALKMSKASVRYIGIQKKEWNKIKYH